MIELCKIGTGEDITIRDFSKLIKEIVGYKGEIVWDTTKPDFNTNMKSGHF